MDEKKTERRLFRFRGSSAAVKAAVLVLLCLLSSCNRERDAMLEQMKEISSTGYEGEELSTQTIEELKADIQKYEEKVAREVEAYGQLGVYYKMLAVEYIDHDMYGLALENLRKAIDIYPENKILFYLAGVSSARMAKAKVNRQKERENLLNEAEQYYLRALDLDPRYINALYGLSILYIFEMNRTVDAEPYLDTILSIETKNVDALFLLARVYLETGRTKEAVDLYDRIIKTSNSAETKQQARENRERILEGEVEL